MDFWTTPLGLAVEKWWDEHPQSGDLGVFGLTENRKRALLRICDKWVSAPVTQPCVSGRWEWDDVPGYMDPYLAARFPVEVS